MTTRFDRDTALVPVGAGAFEGRIDKGWWIERGPNGGYVAAILLRALTMTVDDPERAPRSLTVHYTEAPGEGPVRVVGAVERSGRSLTTVTARMHQQDRLIALAVAAFSRPREAVEFADARMPEVPPPEDCPSWRRAERPMPPLMERYNQRVALGAELLSGAPEAVAGGWMRLAEPRLTDALLVAALADGWMPPVSTRVTAPVAVPTIDLSVHFRASLPLPTATPDDYTLGLFRSRLSHEGFLEEDGELWSADGQLLAQSRQLAAVVPLPPDLAGWRTPGATTAQGTDSAPATASDR